MPNSIDFRADQIQTKQIIVTGSGAGTTKLLIYGIEAQGSPVNEGLINTTYFPQDGIGGDVFLYVSGAVNAKGSATVRGTSVFGGDLVVSGSLYNGAVFGTGVAGDFSHAEGKETRAQGHYSHAEGTGSVASANYSHAEGSGSRASGTGAHAEGFSTRASGIQSHAEGGYTNTDGGEYAHAEGYLTTGSGQASHAEGYGTLASGLYAHAEGYLTTGSGQASHAEGYQTIAFGTGSHASGIGTIASGSTAALSNASIVQAATGRWNKRNNETSLFVIGNGTGDSDALRGDIFRAESTGQLVLSGGISHKVNTQAYIPASFGLPPIPAYDTYNLTLNDYLVIVNVTAGGPFNINLPASATTPIGTTYVIRRFDGKVAPSGVVNIYYHAGDVISDNTGNSIDDTGVYPFPITGVGGVYRGGSVTITYIGNYTDSVLGTYPTWMTTNEFYL